MIKITLADGSVREMEDGSSVLDAAKSISRGLAKEAVAAKVNGEIRGLEYVLPGDCTLEILKFSDEEGAHTFRHTASHILAQAVKKLYPEAKLAIGPAIDNGFYYDFDLEHRFTEEDFAAIEKEMKKIVESGLKLERFELPRAEAQALMDVTRESLFKGINAARPGNRLGDIGSAVQRYVEARGYSVVRDFVGHGVGAKLHEDPSVPNYGTPGRGVRLLPGMTIAIEPMINAGVKEVKTLKDGWTTVTADGKLSAHFEHTIAITPDGPVIMTLPE